MNKEIVPFDFKGNEVRVIGAINIARKSKVTAIQFNTVEQIKGILAYPERIRVANV